MTPDQPTGMNELREQLTEIVVGDISDLASDSQQLVRKRAQYKVDQLEALCQEVARKARLDELKPLQVEAQYESDRSERKELHSNVDGVLNMIDERIAELTQKPAKETEGQRQISCPCLTCSGFCGCGIAGHHV